MKRTIVTLIFGAVSSAAAAELPASIDRVKTGDPAMSCAQTFAEIGNLNQIIAQATSSEQNGNTTAVVADTAGKASESPALGAVPFGGLFGKIIGGIVRNKAQDAGAIGRQAQARKEHLTTLTANKGCKDSDPAYEPPAKAQPTATVDAPKVASVVPVTVSTALPDVNASEYFDGKNGGTFGAKTVETLPKNKRVAIAGFRVVFVHYAKVSASQRSSYLPGGVHTGAAHVAMEISLQGVDEATLQAITDQAYANFVAQLKNAGREVVPMEQLKSFWSSAELASAPYNKKLDIAGKYVRNGLVLSPAGMPLWWQIGEAWGDTGVLNQTNMRALGTLAHEINAIVIAPQIVVDFANVQTSGTTTWTGGAEVEGAIAMSVKEFTSRVLRSEESRSGMVAYGKGEDGWLAQTKAISTDIAFADMTKIKDQKGGLMTTMNIPNVFNVVGSNTRKTGYLAQTTPQAYTNAAITALTQATGIFAKLFKDYPAP